MLFRLWDSRMTDHVFRPTRRTVMAGLGATGLGTLLPGSVKAAETQSLALTAKAGSLVLRPGQAASPAWVLEPSPAPFHIRRGATLDLALDNELPAPVALSWRGLGRVPATDPMSAGI